jgi:hypothetical protein
VKVFQNLHFNAEQIMTPRSVLRCVENSDFNSAQVIADKEKFDAIPIIDHGAILRYWSREQQAPAKITIRHRISHDTPIEKLLPRFKVDGVQFVYYRTEVVGLVDVSDLNKPLARMVWLHPMLVCEQRIIEQSVKRGYEDVEIGKVLGKAAKRVLRKHQNALREDLKLPLLSFAYFRDVLMAGVELRIISLMEQEIEKLNDLRNRLAHPGRNLIEHKAQCDELIWANKICDQILKHL